MSKQQHLPLLSLLLHADPVFPDTCFPSELASGQTSQKRLCALGVSSFPEPSGAYAEIQSYRVMVLLKAIWVPCQGLSLGVLKLSNFSPSNILTRKPRWLWKLDLIAPSSLLAKIWAPNWECEGLCTDLLWGHIAVWQWYRIKADIMYHVDGSVSAGSTTCHSHAAPRRGHWSSALGRTWGKQTHGLLPVQTHTFLLDSFYSEHSMISTKTSNRRGSAGVSISTKKQLGLSCITVSLLVLLPFIVALCWKASHQWAETLRACPAAISLNLEAVLRIYISRLNALTCNASITVEIWYGTSKSMSHINHTFKSVVQSSLICPHFLFEV